MIVAGFGFRSAATLHDLREVLTLAGQMPDALASITAKAEAPALKGLADELALPLIALDETDIAGEQTLTCSPRIKARFGTGSLAEAAALAGARSSVKGANIKKASVKGATVRLLGPRIITANGNATVAFAQATEQGRT